ncbi:DUF6049 family protein [Microbacterium sp. NPDC057407]|uniref:DUF6049 family protein n=1 Tax=Microbacterium sp. NPDC057407 TaxID=3346120 RepID=UPI003672BE43
MTVTHPGKPARRRAPRVAAALLALVTVLATPGLPALADTTTPSPTPTPTPTPQIAPGTTAFTLAPISNGVVPAGTALAVSLTLQNETATSTPATSATVSLGRSPLASRTALTAWLDGDTSGVTTEPVATAALEPVPAGDFRVTPARVEAEDPALEGLTPGVYPLKATYEGPSGPVTATSAIVVPRAGADEIGVGVLVPVTAGALTEGLLTADQLTALTAPDGALTAQLDGVEGTPAILAVDPAVPASIRVLGTAAPATATEWLERLESLPNSRFALQFGDADVSAQLESGLSAPLVPTSLTAYMNPEDFAAEPTPGPEPTPSPSPPAEGDEDAAPALPSLPALLDIGPNARPGIFWPVEGTAGTEVVERLSRVRTDDEAGTTVISSASTSAGAAGQTVPANGAAGESPVLVLDAEVSAALAEASGLEATSLRGAALAEATAYLSFAAAETGGAPLLVTLGRDPDRSRVAIGATIGAATDAPGVTPFTLGGLINSSVGEVQLGEAAAQPARAEVTSTLLEEEGELARFATILDDPSLLTGPERAEILQLLGNGWLPDDTSWTAAIVDHRAATRGTLDSVGLVPSAPINLYGANVGLRFWVRNDLPYPVNLVLYVTPDNLRLDVQRANPLVAQPASNSRVEVPVQARVGNGDVTLGLQLRSRASVAIGEPQSVDVAVRAEWESVGLAILGVVVGGLLLLGVVRTVLRLRARRRSGASIEDTGETDASTPAGSDPSADRGGEP